MSVLLLDIGNTSVTAGFFDGKRIGNISGLKTAGCKIADIENFLDEVVGQRFVEGVALCSVVPTASGRYTKIAKRKYGKNALLIHHKLDLGIGLDYPAPETIGADRLANAVGAVDKYGAPVIVADFGTALTFDIISGNKSYIGGIIMPGLSLMADYFSERTSLLPHIDLKGGRGVVGKSTSSAMKIGAKLGYKGMVREVVTALKKERGLEKAVLCATGGYAKWVLSHSDIPFLFDRTLTLYGILQIYLRNRD